MQEFYKHIFDKYLNASLWEVSECKIMLRDVCLLLVTCKGSIDIDSSFDIIWRQLLLVT